MINSFFNVSFTSLSFWSQPVNCRLAKLSAIRGTIVKEDNNAITLNEQCEDIQENIVNSSFRSKRNSQKQDTRILFAKGSKMHECIKYRMIGACFPKNLMLSNAFDMTTYQLFRL